MFKDFSFWLLCQARRRAGRLVVVAIMAGLLLGLLNWVRLSAAPSFSVVLPPDLVLDQFTVDPPRPRVGQSVTFIINVRNAGLGDAPGWRVQLYIDPPDRPPTTTTPYSSTQLYAITFPPGAIGQLQLSGYVFTQAGCDHVAYAWVDPREGIPESNESNNLSVLPLCVDPAPPTSADVYEPDDVCGPGVAAIPADGSAQNRTFWPRDDVDYVKFDVLQGDTYTATAVGTGRDAHPALVVSTSCDFPMPFCTTTQTVFIAPSSGTYYLRLANDFFQPDPDRTNYQLTLLGAVAPTPQVLLVTPTLGGVITDVSSGVPLTLQVPAGAVLTPTRLVYTPLVTVTGAPTSGWSFAGYAFALEAFVWEAGQGSVHLPLVFSTPVTVVLEYRSEEITGLAENTLTPRCGASLATASASQAITGLLEDTLMLYYWTGDAWSMDGIALVERAPAQHRLVYTVAHLSKFALFGQVSLPPPVYQVYAPLLVGNPAYASYLPLITRP